MVNPVVGERRHARGIDRNEVEPAPDADHDGPAIGRPGRPLDDRGDGWIDPVEELIPILLIQISSYSHFNIRPLFSVVASQSVVDSLADQKPKVMGYETPR